MNKLIIIINNILFIIIFHDNILHIVKLNYLIIKVMVI